MHMPPLLRVSPTVLVLRVIPRLRFYIAMSKKLELLYAAAGTRYNRLTIARAGFAKVVAWTGWLRVSELFNLAHEDIRIIHPSQSAEYSLPVNTGIICLKLALETKTSRSEQADVSIATTTYSGFSPLTWYDRIISQLRSLNPNEFVFLHHGDKFTSSFFRRTYTIPLLQLMQLQGEPTLQPYTMEKGDPLPEAFCSMHSYRRGANTHVTTPRPSQLRAATIVEIYEHGRWRVGRHRESMPAQYTALSLAERQALTLCRM
jgi:hypothetical protein